MTPTVPFTVTSADFQTGFVVMDIATNQVESQINPDYCATMAATERLQAHLNVLGLHPVISMDYPDEYWGGGGPFQQTGPNGATGAGAMVPYLDFTNSTTGAIDHENAGGILVEYMECSQRLCDWNCTNNWYAGDM